MRKLLVAQESGITVSQEFVAATVNHYADQFRGLRQKSSENIIEMACVVCAARSRLSEIQFGQFCKAIGYNCKSSSIRKFEQIGKQAALLSKYFQKLPNNWTSLYNLVQLDPVILESVLDDGTVSPDITGTEIQKLVAEHKPPEPGNCKRATKYHYKCGVTFDAPLDEVVQRELDKLITDFIAKKAIGTPICSPNGGN